MAPFFFRRNYTLYNEKIFKEVANMLYTQTLTQDDNFVRVGLLLKRIVNKYSDRIKKAMEDKEEDKAMLLIHDAVEEIQMSLNKAHVVGQKEFKILSKIEYDLSRAMANIFHYQDTGKSIPLLKVYAYWLLGVEVRVARLHNMG
jgi:hypothetical protein